jgi:hypothetical protein
VCLEPPFRFSGGGGGSGVVVVSSTSAPVGVNNTYGMASMWLGCCVVLPVDMAVTRRNTKKTPIAWVAIDVAEVAVCGAGGDRNASAY